MDIRTAETTSWFPLSISQRSRCFVYELEPQNRGNHNNVFAARLEGAVDPAAVDAALRGLVARHPMLRAEVSIEQGQRILAEMPFALNVVDATGMSADALLERVHADAWAPFVRNEAEGPRPLLRSCLYVTGPAESVFLLALDHLICDGWSYWHLLEELGAELSGNEVAPDAAAAATYREYVSWQHELVHGSRGARQVAHWEKVLAGDAAPLRLPFDRRRPAQSSHRQGFVTRRLGTSLKERLQSGRADEGATLYNSLVVALQILLHRYTGQDRVVIGAAVPGRSQAAWKNVVGDFANVLPLRADFDEQPTARTMLRNCQRALLSALRNQDYPFPRLVEELGIAYGDENPIYQVSFVFQKPRRAAALARLWNEHNSGEAAPRWGGLTLQPFPIEQRVGQDSRVALTVHAVEIDDDARCDFVYDVDVFDAATMERMADHFVALLEEIVADPDRTAHERPLLSAEERRQLLVDFNAAPGAPLDEPRELMHELFEQQAAARPDAPAVVFEDRQLTYAELNARANQLAHELIALGVRPDDRVAICAERSLEMVVGLLGILKAGGAYVPLDPAAPADRLQSMVGDAQPRVLVTQQALGQALPATGLPVLFLDGDAFAARPTTNPDARALGLTLRNLAYVIYTSGSTGRPKGVMVEQRSVLNLWQALQRLDFVEAGAGARVGLNASIGFDASVQSLLQLLSGHCVVVFPQSVRADADAFLRYAEAHALDAFDCTPAQLALLLQAGLGKDDAGYQPKAVLVGGESIGVPLWQSLKAIRSTRFFNVYGPTECTVDATACALHEAGDRPVIGRPLGNVTVYILDAHGQPVPVGVEGELYIGGVQVARGYLNRPELTAERFLRDPFSADPHARMYRTGDLGRWLPDGNIEYAGRNDHQVKIRGYRIELGEIEVQLAQCAGVREAVVLAREDVAGDKRLVAYLVPQDGAVLEAVALRNALQAQLPEYMVPSAFVVLEALPLTPNGKLDRKALPVPELGALIASEYEAPEGEVEQKLAALWQELLRVEQVGRQDRFFELGGHSLLAMQLTSHIRAAFGVELPLRQVFANSTLSGLAEVVRAAGASTMGRIQRADRNQPLPLSLAQQRLWFLDRLDRAASASYAMPAALRLLGKLDVAALQATLDGLVARHEVLRTSFAEIDGVPYQQIAPADRGFALGHEDLSALSADEREAAVARLTVEEARAPFDLSAGPMIRGRLLRVSEAEHVLLVTQHHIITDGWSIDVMVREVGALYTAFLEGSADPLPPLELQYADYAQWQREWLQGEELTRQLGFWKEHLAGAPALLELPLDRPRPAEQSHAGATVPVALSPELTASLRTFSQRHGVTLYMTLLSAWGVLLSRLSGQQDIVIGTPVANRQRQELESLIGFFVNMLAVRLRLDEKPSVASLLAQVKETTLAAFAHQELPFEQVVEAVQPQRSLSHSPLAQVTFTWNNLEQATDGSTLQLPGLTLAPVPRAHETIQVDLQMLLDDAGDVVTGMLVYARDLFDRETIERWTGHFVRLLEAMAADASTDIDALPLLSEAERRQVLASFNDTAVAYPSDALIHQLFERQAAQQPDAVAVVYEDESLTYGELNARANQLAHYLIGLGVKPDDRVAICCPRNAELIVGLLGILKAGGSYVPLDPGYPQERLTWMLEDSAPVALLSHSDVEDLLPETELPVLRLDVDLPVLARRLPASDPVVTGLHARHLAYVIYTSGSTGTPKGVMVEHRNVNRLVINNPYFSAAAGDCFAHCANPAFDAATWEIWGALLNGARLLVLPPSVVMDPALLDARLRDGGVTALWLTVGLFNQYVDSLPDAFGQLRYLLVGGDALDPKTIRQLLQRERRPAHVVNGYGPTETTTFAITHDIREVADDARSIPLGKPLANTEIYVLDAQGEPVPVGVEGEIYIAGDGVARGYLNRPELTAERFVRNPFRADAEARMYKTGDRGRWLADGTIEFLGRNDFQVKLRGFRIELGEIESKLAQCDGVRDAVVLAREDAPGDKRLVAYLVAAEGTELSVADLRDALSRQLPDYMLPSAFVQLDRLPLTANGKLDRQALPAPEATALTAHEYEAPQGPIEEALAALWQELLHVERVGRHDQFFELGGHSLLAVQLISQVRAKFGVELPLRELFVNSSLSALAEAVRAAGASTMGRMERADRTQPLPLSLAQQRLWFLDQLDGAASAAYHMPAALRLLGQLDAAALQATLDRLVARHEGLRTSFIAIDGVPYQQIAPEDRGFALVHEDLSALPAAEREAVVARVTAEEARAPFDLSTGPMIRGRLLRVSETEHVLLVTQHHIVSDGWSIDVMVREVGALYTAFLEGSADPLPPLEVQYADYAQWQRNWLQGEELTRQLGFWKDHLTGAPELLELPLDRPRPAVQSYAGGLVPVALPAELTAELRAFSQRHGVTLYMTLLAAWGVLLSRLSGQQDVVVGTPVANRQRQELESLIGFFVNMLAVRLRLDEKPSVEALLARVKETTLAAFAHQELPFEQVVEAVQPQRSLSHSPLAQVTFTWNNLERVGTDGSTLELPGLTLAPVHRAHETIQVDLQLLLDDAGDVVKGMLVYARDLFDRETIERWTGHFVQVLQAMVADPSVAVDALPLLSAAERHEVLEAFNETDFDFPKDALIHELFEQQAAQQPDAVAVVSENESLSYGELNTRANQLAHYLIQLGVKADDRVAICCERNTDLIVGLLGILKAGGAYMPLDPSHPRERLAWMLEDSAPVALLTHSDLEELLPEAEMPVLRLDVDLPVLARRLPEHNPDARGLTSGNLAYVIYTSGSTGTPKGVMVEQRDVVGLVRARDYVALDRTSVVAQASNASFDAATFEIWGALLNGGRLVIIGKETLIEPARLQERLVAERVDTLFVTTALFNRIAKLHPSAFATLKTLLFGGEMVSPDIVAAFVHDFPGRLLHVYGPTENTTYATWYHVRPERPTEEVPRGSSEFLGVPRSGFPTSPSSSGEPDELRGTVTPPRHSEEPEEPEELRGTPPVPIGRGLAGARVYVLDAHRQPVPVGVAGEIYVGGHGVARGYLNRPELTAERFVSDPFRAEPGARMYKTGDLGRWLPGGNIEFLARNDFQVKIRGFRIELGEVEAKLGACAGVREVIVLAREDEPGDKRLVAYLVAQEGAELSVSDLREALSRQLPEYMVPSAFVQLDLLPLNANGKIDRKALPAPEAAALSVREYEAPEGEIEQTIAALWQEQLRVARVGRHDNFFELGGHSLLAVQLISHIRAALGVEVPLRDLFASPSLAALAEAVRAAGASTMDRIQRADRSQPLPLSLSQQRLWFLHQLNDRHDRAASVAYHMPAAFRLRGNLNVPALQATLDRLVARHENLRTRFVAADGVPYQEIAAEDCGFALQLEDLRMLSVEDREAAVTRIAAEEAHAPFDLSAGPLIRGRLLTLAAGEHVLLITQHHIVSDGWSLSILVREVAALYTAFHRGETDALPPLAVQYADYAQWQRNWLRGEELTRQVEFWREQLTGAPALLELPLDHARPAVQSHAGGSVPLALSPELTAGLRALSQEHGVTLFMTLLSAWGVLLSRLSGQQDVVIGTPVANRQRHEVEGLIGFFVNTLAMRMRLDGEPTLAALLAQVKETTLAAFAHQELPFEQVVEAVQPQRSLSYSPVAQTALALNNTADYGGAMNLPELSLTPVEQALTTALYELSVHLSDTGEDLSGFLVYASDLFDRTTVERWAGHYVRLLEAMVADAAAGVGKLPLLSAPEREQLLAGFNAPEAAYPQDALIHELFERQAAARPDAVAVVFENQSLTYGELDARANRVARELLALGVQPDDRVAICVERSLEMIVGLLGILKAGGAYVPLDPAYPVERLRYMLDDSAPVALLTQSGLQGLVAELASHAPVVDISAAQFAQDRDASPAGVTPGHLAYIIYTSGSTGAPKGVMVEHRNVVRLFTATEEWFHFDANDVWTMFHSYAFDFSVWEIWGALLYGGRLVVVPQETSRTPDEFYELVCSSGTTILNQTPSAFRQFIAAQRDSGAAHRLRHVIFGGEALEVATLEPWFERNGDRQPRLVNMYGITETTVHVTYRPLDRADTARGGSPIGCRIPDLAVYILDAHREPAPIGVAGELYIGGAGVARGYLNRPELTAERFLDDPFVARNGARMYKSGDLGRRLPDGSIDFIGRNDAQVKIRGFRIELGEIEAKLSQCAGVREAVVIAREDVAGDKRLVAYLVAEEDAMLQAADLRAALLAELPEYMVPAAFVALDALPLTTNGKLDRKALPEPETAALTAREYEAPQGETEETLAAIWRELLRVERAGRQDQFFELGGHSLLAVQLISRIRATLGVDIALRDLFAQPDLQALAGAIERGKASTMTRIETADRSQPLPLSLAQQRLWFLHQLDRSASAAYHMPAALRLTGRLDVTALQATLDRVVARHEGLRTSFVSIDGVPYQQIAPAGRGFALTVRDLRALDGESRDRMASEFAAEEASAPFDLSVGPLIRGQLLALADDEHLLLITQHHIVTDGWSIGILVREVAELYTAFRNGGSDPLPPLEVQYADYAQWQRGWLQGEELTRQLGFWKEHLTGAPALLELPLDRPRPAVESHAGGSLPLVLSAELTEGLRAFSQRHGVTLFMTLLSAWGLLLSRLSGQQDVVVGTPVANRQRREVEGLIGFFVNTLALRLRFDDHPTLASLLAQVKDTTLAAFAHQELPFEQVVDAVQPQRSLSHSPLFQTLLALNNTAGGGDALRLPDLDLVPVELAPAAAQYELSLHLEDGAEAVSGLLVYASDLFDRSTVERWAGHYVRLLEAMVLDPAATAGMLPMLSDAERQQVLEGFNATAAEYPEDTLLHELFEEQAAAQPDTVAVVFENRSLTYGELNARANQLAHELIALGVQPDDRVAICADRSLEMVVGLLGILKAGGAYVPLDPAYPIDRLQYMFRDAEPKALLTQQALHQALPASDVQTLVLDSDELSAKLAARPSTNPDVHGLTVRNLAYVIYTSGSTGMPKGVLNEHRGIVNRLWWAQSEYRLQHDDRALQKTPFSFDVSVWEFFLPLLAGARLVMARPGGHQDPSYLADVIAREQITTIHFVPSMLPAFLTQANAENCRSLRRVKCSGEALPHNVVEELAGRLPHVEVHNLYGPTEAAVDVTAWPCRVGQYGQTIPIGKPVANTRIYLLDVHGEPVPAGVAGELYIGGVQVARGYLNRPELTAERFVSDPFRTEADARMYKTGDLARWLPDGNIEYLGRNDFQVKIRGFRIELGEIEARLAQCAGVREAVVIAREAAAGDKRLVAYVVAEDGVTLQAAELRAALLAHLPEYMVPSAFVMLEALPLTPNGKLDRKALPAPETAALAAREYEAPQGEIEEQLAAIWQELLRVERVGRHDSFFELGGHSLLAVQMQTRIAAALLVEVPLRTLIVAGDLRQLATEVAELQFAKFLGEDMDEELSSMSAEELQALLETEEI
ncbi:MAG TPA: non-ribosomal peptide synthase/polyketide synthase [Thermoanaerobaculia bacterium]